MFAVSAARFDAENPISGLEFGEHADPVAPDGWTTVRVRAASLNHHDVWSLRGVGLSAERLPMILGCDAAGVDEDGREVVVHAVIGDPLAVGGDETLDPSRTLLSEVHQGTFAELVTVPRRNLVPKPAALSFEEAACLLNMPPPPAIQYEIALTAMSPMARSFWAEHRKVSSRATCAALGIAWLYPTYREGLRAILLEESRPKHTSSA